MKKLLALSASAIVLMSVPALAQTNNSSTVTQSGNDNHGEINQLGTGASSTVTQSSSDNDVLVKQKGAGSVSSVNQTGADNGDGRNNQAEVSQTGASTSRITQSGANAQANVLQDGTGNDSTVDQSGNGATTGYTEISGIAGDRTGVEQLGENNRSYVEQKGGSFAIVEQDNRLGLSGGNYSDVYQGSGNGGVVVKQTGGGNGSLVNQQTTACCGNDNPEAFVTQIGELNYASISQTTSSAGSTARIEQTADNNRSYITQDMQGADAPLNTGSLAVNRQMNDDNYSEISQTATDNEATVTQSGVNNDSYVYQSNSGNIATVDQLSDDNYSFVNQTGTGNDVAVTQGN